MRICRHDALVNIIYNSLSQDHPGVLKEQQVSCPDFQHRCSAYFDIFICSTTQPTFISSTASCAGVVAAAGEIVKDEKHLAAVEKV